MSNVAAAIGAGSVVGFTLGLVGGGGSILAAPLLLYVVGLRDAHVAIGTSALAVAVNAWANLIAHARMGHVWWKCAVIFAGAGVLGAWLGATLGMMMDPARLLFLFGLVMVVVGLLMLRPRGNPGRPVRAVDARMCWVTAATAVGIGIASGFFGIGGGFLIVPALIFATGMPMINAIGSSLLAIGAFGFATALSYARAGLVDWVVAGEFIAGGVLGGILGMLLATRLAASRTILNRIFAVLILGVAAYVIARNLPGA